MKPLMMIATVLSLAACSQPNVRSDTATGPPVHLEPGEYWEKTDNPSSPGDGIVVFEDQSLQYVPSQWSGNPRSNPWYPGRVEGNRIVVRITGNDGDPSGPDWKPTTPGTSSFDIRKASKKKLVLKSLGPNLKIEGYVATFVRK